MFLRIGKFNLKNYFFLTVPLIKIIREVAGFSDSFYGVKNILFQYLFLCVAKFANVIFWFILMKKIKIEKNINQPIEKDNNTFEIINDCEDDIINIKKTIEKIDNNNQGLSQREINFLQKEKMKKKKFYKNAIIIIISSVLDFIANFSYLILYASLSKDKDDDNKKNYTLINLIPIRISLRIILMFLHSLLFLFFDRPYRHQMLSIFLILIISIIAYFLEIIIKIINKNDKLLKHITIVIWQEFFFCIDNVIGAKYLTCSTGNVYKLLFFNGSFGLVMILIINFLTGKINCSKIDLDKKYCRNDDSDKLKFIYNLKVDKTKIIKVLISLLLSIIEMACTWLLICYQTVNHLSIACAMHLSLRFTLGRDNENNNHIIIGIVSFILICFLALVYNEIIVLKFCNLEKNTSEEIEQRAIEDKILGERISNDGTLDDINTTN